MITVKLNADLRNGRGKSVELEFSEGMNLHHIVERLGIDKDHIFVILVKGKRKTLDYILDEDDVISLFPPIAGG